MHQIEQPKLHEEIAFEINRERSQVLKVFALQRNTDTGQTSKTVENTDQDGNKGQWHQILGRQVRTESSYIFRRSCCSTEEENIWQNTHHQEDLHHKGSIAQESAMILNDKSSKGVFLTHMEYSHALFNGLVGRNCKGRIIELRDHDFANQADQDQKDQDPAQKAKDRFSIKRMEDELMKSRKRWK